jgi:hypothetical protein
MRHTSLRRGCVAVERDKTFKVHTGGRYSIGDAGPVLKNFDITPSIREASATGTRGVHHERIWIENVVCNRFSSLR